MTIVGGHAVVLGASMAGLLAARVLTEFYDRVTVVERDELVDEAAPRRGVPQSCQPHVMLARCGQVVDELFPGCLDELVAAGAHRWDDGDMSRFDVRLAGHLIQQVGVIPDPASLVNHYASRPFLEQHVRRRVRALPTVTVLDGHLVDTLLASRRHVTGVRVCDRLGAPVELDADLVVDASGRGSRAPTFLEHLGYRRPEVDELTVRVAYASMPVRIPAGVLRPQMIIRLFEPGQPRAFVMSQCENDTWMVAAGTLGGVRPPRTPEELLAFGEGVVPDYALAAVRAAQPLASVRTYQYPSNRWRRFDKLTDVPTGFVVIGDAVCSFNPIYGQGMSVAAVEAMVLRDCLRHGAMDLPRRFYRQAAKPIRVAWQSAVGSDLRLPEVAGRRPLSTRLTNAYTDRVLGAAEIDPYVAQEFLRVIGMLSEPSSLLRPSFVWRVERVNRRRRRAPRAHDVPSAAAVG
jgi:2-polyprenyl-6-methoxyphenol hydroxylase-like FAD-dependent oxidoreductase